MQEPVVEPPQVQNRLEPGGCGPDRSARPSEVCSGDSVAGELGRRGGHDESLRRSRGDAAGEKLGASPVERSAVNVGTVLGLPYLSVGQAAGGQARRQPMTLRWDGVLVVVRAWESHVHGEGGQRVRSCGTGTPGGRR